MTDVRIILTGHGRGEVFIDGQKMPGVTAIEFSASTSGKNTLVLTIVPERVEVEGPAEVTVK